MCDVSFSVEPGSLVGVIGPNGSGKTTLFNVVSGAFAPTSGTVAFEGGDITGRSPDHICRAGIARTFQIPQPIRSMSVVENVMVGVVFGTNEHVRGYSHRDAQMEALKLIDFVGLKVDPDSFPERLTAGDLRKLELARALATKPKILLADEVMSGLNREELKESSRILERIRGDLGITIIWVEHIMQVLMKLVERVIVLNYGTVICDGDPETVCNDSEVIEAYLGAGETK